MIDHIDLPVRDYQASRDFYLAALAPLGYTAGWQPAPTVGCLLAPIPAGPPAPTLWLHEDPHARGDMHLAFLAPDRTTVKAFHAAALAAGGTDNGAPGERPEYHSGYYAAYVLDPDGANIEAVCHHE